MQYQEHFGKKFYLDHKTGYWISTTCPKIRAHVWVWIHHHCEVEKGFHIHHIDGNKSNNDISNLKKMSEHDHLSHHMTTERRKWAREWVGVIRPLTKKWHSSEEGHLWHKKHGIEGWLKKPEIERKCSICFSIFLTKTYHQSFCSNKCKSEFRRRSGLDDVVSKCQFCLSEFKRNKYARQRFCSRKCSNRWRKSEVNP